MDDVDERAVLGSSYPSESATAASDKTQRLERRTDYSLELSVEFAQPGRCWHGRAENEPGQCRSAGWEARALV
jgi:hypothetical protein